MIRETPLPPLVPLIREVVEAAKALLIVLSNPSPGRMHDRIAAERRLRAALVAFAEQDEDRP